MQLHIVCLLDISGGGVQTLPRNPLDNNIHHSNSTHNIPNSNNTHTLPNRSSSQKIGNQVNNHKVCCYKKIFIVLVRKNWDVLYYVFVYQNALISLFNLYKFFSNCDFFTSTHKLKWVLFTEKLVLNSVSELQIYYIVVEFESCPDNKSTTNFT